MVCGALVGYGHHLITDTRAGRQYGGKADGLQGTCQRWSVYAANGDGGDVEPRGMNPTTFRHSPLRVIDRSTPEAGTNIDESHYKLALDSRFLRGLKRN